MLIAALFDGLMGISVALAISVPLRKADKSATTTS